MSLAMVRPVSLAVDDEPAARSSIEGELRKRYETDYEVICEGLADHPDGLEAGTMQLAVVGPRP